MRNTIFFLISLGLAAIGALLSPATGLSQDDDLGELGPVLGVLVDGRALERFELEVSLEGLPLSGGQFEALLQDDTLEVVETTGFSLVSVEADLGSAISRFEPGRLVVEGLAGAVGDSTAPWGVLVSIASSIGPVELRMTSLQRLDDYIVQFADGYLPAWSSADLVEASAIELLTEIGAAPGDLRHVLAGSRPGFSARLSVAAAAQLRTREAVGFLQANGYLSANTVQRPVSWALDRIDERNLPEEGFYDYGTTGSGVNLYVFDTEIRDTHEELSGRVVESRDFVDPMAAAGCRGEMDFHGTYMASLAAGVEYGVAKQAAIRSIVVLDCDGRGTEASLAAGLLSVANSFVTPAVANFSLAGDQNAVVDQAVRDLIDVGVTVVASAGNVNADACQLTPAGVAAALAVGASNGDDERWANAGQGPCVDLYAPGVDIEGAGFASDTATQEGQGSSQAVAFVSGAVARLLESDPAASPAQIHAAIVGSATPGVLTGLWPNSPNRLLFIDDRQAPGIVYRSHVAFRGWLSWAANGAMTGTTGESRRAEAFEVEVNDLPAGIGVCYAVESKNTGWSTACDGATAGTTGQSRRAELLQIWLTGPRAPGCNLEYRVHGKNYGWQSWQSNGATAGVAGRRIEALEARLTPQCFDPVPPPPPRPPNAQCVASPSSGFGPVLVAGFDASQSDDPDGSIVSYTWDFNGGTALGASNSSMASASFVGDPNADLYYFVSVTVTDDDGLVDRHYCPVQVRCIPDPLIGCMF